MPLLTTNGKVDRRACLHSCQHARNWKKPCSSQHPVEELLNRNLGATWHRSSESASTTTSLSWADTLLATQVISIWEAFQVELPLRRLFEAPTVFSLAEQIEMAIKAKPGLTPWPIERVSRQVYRCLCSAATMVPPPLDPGSTATMVLPLCYCKGRSTWRH